MRRNFLILFAIMILGLCLRLLLINGGIDLDESVTEYVSASQTLNELLDRIVHYEFGPPLYFYLMMLWRKITPDQTIYLALPSLFFGVILIPLTFFLAKKLSNSDKTSLVAALFCAISPLALFYSHEARVYALFSCLNVASAYFYIDWLTKKNKFSLTAFAICASLVAYTHYLGFFSLGLLALGAIFYCLIERKIESFFKSLPVFFLPAALFLPWLSNMKEHLSAGTYWVERTPFDQWWQVIDSNTAALAPVPWILGAIVSIPILVAFLIFGIKKKLKFKKSEIAFLLTILIPPIVLLGYITPFILGYCRYMMPFAPFAWILLASLIVDNFKAKVTMTLLAVLIMLNSWEAYCLGSMDRSGLRKISYDIANNHFGDSLYLILPDFDTYTLRYYLRIQSPDSGNTKIISFPNLDMQHPTPHQGYAATWTDPENVNNLFAYLDKCKEKNLVVIRDPAVLESSKMPAKSRIQQVMDRLYKNYQKIGNTSEYKAKGRTFLVERFNLFSNK